MWGALLDLVVYVLLNVSGGRGRGGVRGRSDKAREGRGGPHRAGGGERERFGDEWAGAGGGEHSVRAAKQDVAELVRILSQDGRASDRPVFDLRGVGLSRFEYNEFKEEEDAYDERRV